MGLNDALPAGATPLDGEELEGLLPTHLVDRSQLNEWEQRNIESALLWLSRRRRPRRLQEAWLRRLHRLVSIHPFPNGNGRHARLIADVLIEQLGALRFSWGGGSTLVDASALRRQFIAALQQVDRGQLDDLLTFARGS